MPNYRDPLYDAQMELEPPGQSFDLPSIMAAVQQRMGARRAAGQDPSGLPPPTPPMDPQENAFQIAEALGQPYTMVDSQYEGPLEVGEFDILDPAALASYMDALNAADRDTPARPMGPQEAAPTRDLPPIVADVPIPVTPPPEPPRMPIARKKRWPGEERY